MGSFINWLNSHRLNPAIKGSMGAVRMVLEIVLIDVTTGIELEPTPGLVPALAVGLDMVKICDEGDSRLDEESEEPGKCSVWRLRGLRT